MSFAGGDGTEDSPFEVSSAGELANIGQLLYCNFRLTQDIDLSGVANWTPLGAESPCDGGNDDACFQGTLDGNDFMISDLTVNITEDYGGLFGYTGEHSEIRSVGLRDLNVMAGANTGGLVGYNGGSISNSYTTGAVSSTGNTIGGLVGNNAGSISNSYATGAVSSTGGTIGGLVGNNAGSISNSYATGAVSVSLAFVGGLVGGNAGSISNSYATGMIESSARSAFAGGLVGRGLTAPAGSISNSYAAGTASSAGSVPGFLGGLAGSDDGSFSDINYFASGTERDAGGSAPVTLDGVGVGSCDAAVCVQATGGNDAARAEWLRDHDDFDESDLGWESTVWGNLDAVGYPCLKDMPTGAEPCS